MRGLFIARRGETEAEARQRLKAARIAAGDIDELLSDEQRAEIRATETQDKITYKKK